MFYKTINVLHPVASEQRSCGTTTQLNHSLGETSRMSAKKRKASPTPDSPRKRLKCASEPAQLASEAVPAQGGKRKASSQRGTPEKKQKCGPSCTNSSDAIRGSNWKEQDGSEKLPVSATPSTANGERARDPSPGSSSPSASTQNSGSSSLPFTCDRARFEAKYQELSMIGQGGFGSVYAGRRREDNLPVAIKHILKQCVRREQVVLHGRTSMVPLEFLLMMKVGGGPVSVGKSAAVSVLDWYDLEQEVLLVMERPDPCVELLEYLKNNGGPLEEDVAKNIMKQLVDAALEMHRKGVFHRDIKAENVLIETGSNDPRVRLIDFGCSCWVRDEPYSTFAGTRDYTPPEFFLSKRYEAESTTVWQLGTLLYEMLSRQQQFSTFDFLHGDIYLSDGVSQDCRNFWEGCLVLNPSRRATLEQIQLHPWLQNQPPDIPQALAEMPSL